MGRAGQSLNLQLHQPLGSKADHLAQQIGVGTLFQKCAKVPDLVGHRWFLESGCVSQPDLIDESSMADRKLLARYSAIEGALARSLLRSVTPLLGTRP